MINVFLFGVSQIMVQLLFKWGCISRHYYLCFVMANIISIGSTCFLTAAYKQMNPNLAFGLCIGMAFLLSQIALCVVFKSSLVPMQWMAVLLISTGILLFAVMAPENGGKKMNGNTVELEK